MMLQPHTQRSQSGPQPCFTKARESDVEQVHGQSVARKLHPIACAQSRQLQVSLCWPVHSHGNANAKQGQNAELTGSHIAHGQSASASKERESIGLFLTLRWCSQEIGLYFILRTQGYMYHTQNPTCDVIFMVLFNMPLYICGNYRRTFCYTVQPILKKKNMQLH